MKREASRHFATPHPKASEGSPGRGARGSSAQPCGFLAAELAIGGSCRGEQITAPRTQCSSYLWPCELISSMCTGISRILPRCLLVGRQMPDRLAWFRRGTPEPKLATPEAQRRSLSGQQKKSAQIVAVAEPDAQSQCPDARP